MIAFYFLFCSSTMSTNHHLDRNRYTITFSSSRKPLKYSYLCSMFLQHLFFLCFCGLDTSKFTTGYKKCVAKASLLQASIVLQIEKNLGKQGKRKANEFYKRYCSPLVSVFVYLNIYYLYIYYLMP